MVVVVVMVVEGGGGIKYLITNKVNTHLTLLHCKVYKYINTNRDVFTVRKNIGYKFMFS